MTTHDFVQVCSCRYLGGWRLKSGCPIHDPRPASTTTTTFCMRCEDLQQENAKLKEALLLIGNLSSATLKGVSE